MINDENATNKVYDNIMAQLEGLKTNVAIALIESILRNLTDHSIVSYSQKLQ